MDAEGLGRKLLLTLATPKNPTKQTVGTVTASHKVLTLALSSSLDADTAKIGCLGRGKAFGLPPAVCPPKRPRPFTHYRLFFSVATPAEPRNLKTFLLQNLSSEKLLEKCR